MPRRLVFVTVLGIATSACQESAPTLIGRWQSTRQPREWLELASDSTFVAQAYMDTTLIRGTYHQHGSTVTLLSVYGHSGTLTLRDSILVMQDGTTYRRLAR
jgi:hypothetical protein